jgi:hypothetical protein
VLATTSCKHKPPPVEEQPLGSEIANLRVHDHILSEHRPVHIEHLGAETVWSDSAIIERAEKFPAPIQQLIDAPPVGAPLAKDAMVQFLQDHERRKAEWQVGTTKRAGTADLDCSVASVASDTTGAKINCIYLNYLEARYPNATLLVKGVHDPVLFFVGAQLRAAIMPIQ